MKLLYEKDLVPYLEMSSHEVLTYAYGLVNSHNAIKFQMANELSYLLRRRRRFSESAEIARMMYEESPSPDRLNLYFVAVVDEGDINKIRELSNLTDCFLKERGISYQKHLFATWLKGANKILDNQLFDYVYSMVPEEEKIYNSYIISQFYVYKNRCSQYQEVCDHYATLPRHMQDATFVKRYYENARARMGYQDTLPSRRTAADSLWATPAKDKNNIFFQHLETSVKPEDWMAVHKDASIKKRVFLVYSGNPSQLPVIEALLSASQIPYTNLSREVKTGSTIIEAFENQASRTDFAIVLCTPENEGVNGVWYPRLNLVFEYGYFMSTLGRENVCLLRYEGGRKLELPTDFSSIHQISMDQGSWATELGSALKTAGFSVNF